MDFTLVGLQKIESNMDTDLRELNELPRSLHTNYLEFFKHFLSIYFCYIDYTKAFACVDHNKLWKILQEIGIPEHLTLGFPGGSETKESACNVGDLSSIPG